MSRRPLRVAFGLALGATLLLAACSAEPLAGRSTNVVFLTEDACDYFVVQSLGRAYAVLARQTDDLAPRQGDVLEGGVLRRGRATLRYLPLGTDVDRDDASEVVVQVDRPNLNVTEAQARLAEACTGSP